MPRVKLTAGRMAAFKCPSDKYQDFLWDTVVPGLGVRATRANTNKAFVFQGRIGASEPRITIGDIRTLDIETGDPNRPGAREEARRMQREIDQGIDPRQAKAERIAASAIRKATTVRHDALVSEAWHVYLAARTPQWSTRHLADHTNMAAVAGADWKRGKRKTIGGPLAPLMPLKLRELDGDRVKLWLRGEQRRPTQARIAFGALRAFINWCSDHPDYRDIVQIEACAPRVAKRELPKKASKSDCLLREQLPAWFKPCAHSAIRCSPPICNVYC